MTSTAKLILAMVTIAGESTNSYSDAILIRIDKLIDLYIKERLAE
jgi:hypothetical protein